MVWIGNIELTNFCSFNCEYCPRKKLTRKIGYMKFDIFKEILNNIDKFYYLHHFGNSLTHPKIFEFIEYAVSRGFKDFTLGLMGAELTKDNIEKLIKSRLPNICISFYGWDEKSFNEKQSGNFNLIKNNIKKLLGKINIKFDFLYYQKEEIMNYKLLEKEFKPAKFKYKKIHNWELDNSITSPSILYDGRIVGNCKDYNGKNIIAKNIKEFKKIGDKLKIQ